jgi:hypothetical protein
MENVSEGCGLIKDRNRIQYCQTFDLRLLSNRETRPWENLGNETANLKRTLRKLTNYSIEPNIFELNEINYYCLLNFSCVLLQDGDAGRGT